MKGVIAAIAAIAVAGIGLVAAQPASADSQVTLSVNPGTVGVSQVIDAQVNSGGLGSSGTVTFTANGTVIGTDNVGPQYGYDAQVNWIPNVGGQRVNLSATYNQGGSDSTSVYISTVGTTTTITSPGTAASGSTITLSAQVRAKTGSYAPTGSVSFYTTSSGNSIGNASVNAQGTANLSYNVGNVNGNVAFYAIYNGDANATRSNPSPTTTTRVSAQGSTVSLVVPQTNYQNSPVTVTANINPTSGTGNVTFTVNGTNIGTRAVANGSASVTWVPTALGNPQVVATYSGGNGVSASSDTKVVAVVPALKSDVITINPDGPSGPILNNASYRLANGASMKATISSQAGLPVNVAVVGPCSYDPTTTTFSVRGVGGNCTVTATTAGGNGYAPGKLVFIITQSAGTQTANVSAPKSGSYKVNKVLTLAKKGTVTNLNQAITWQVTAGGSYCKVATDKYGARVLKLVKRGRCSVRGTAPEIPGQWNAYSTSRDYRVV